MIQLEDEARRKLDDYLGQVRAALAGCKSVDADDVERDVRAHIDDALHGAGQPVTAAALQGVLDDLGGPTQWLPREEIAWWRRVTLELRTGPEDFRLAYISLGLLVLGAVGALLTPAIFLVLLGASFLVARATVSVAADRDGLSAQRWLVYPPLVMVYAPVAFFLLTWPAWLMIPFAEVVGDMGFGNATRADTRLWIHNTLGVAHDSPGYWVIALSATAIVSMAWLLLLAVVSWRRPPWPRAIFRPLLDRVNFARVARWVAWLAVIVWIVSFICMFLTPASLPSRN